MKLSEITPKLFFRSYIFLLFLVLVCCIGYGISFPLIGVSLERSGATSAGIGLNAAMPAVGWLLGSVSQPWILSKINLRKSMVLYICIGLVGLIGLGLSQSSLAWLPLRLLFGGGLGMFFRSVELWVNLTGTPLNRGRRLGVYSAIFIGGLGIGSAIQPEIGFSGGVPYVVIACLISIVGLALIVVPLKMPNKKIAFAVGVPSVSKVWMLAPFALIGTVAYGLFEDVPGYLLSVYALKLGMSEHTAAYTLTAVSIGLLLFAVPLGILSDKVGRLPVLFLSTFVCFFAAVVAPLFSSTETYFLISLMVWGGFFGVLYNTSLALIGDVFENSDTIVANSSFGMLYAGAAIVGPLLNGAAMHLWEPHGLMFSSALIFGAALALFGWLWAKGRNIAG